MDDSPHLIYELGNYDSSSVKVVACPFCGVSTSSGEVITITIVRMLFRCFSCQKIAFCIENIKVITKEEVERLHPQCSVANNTYYSMKICKIISMSCMALCKFSKPENITDDDVIAFYNNLKKFGNENKIDINYDIDKDIAHKFFKGNDLAKKYEIEYTGYNGDNKYLSLRVDSYSLSSIPFGGNIVLYLIGKNSNSAVSMDINDLTI